MHIRKIEPGEATFSDAIDMAKIIVHSFQKDQLFKVLIGPLYFPSPPVGSYYYNKLIFSQALKWWQVIKNGSSRSWKLVGESNEMIGFCSWTPPASQSTAQTRWVRIKNWIRTKVANFLQHILAIGDGNQSMVAQMNRLIPLFQEIDDEIGWLKVDRSKLAHLNQDELSKTIYHKDDIWWCAAMAILPEHQGKGLGYKLFSHTFDSLEPFNPTFRDGDLVTTGPAKYGLCASNEGRILYEKCGFTLYNNYSRMLGGEELPRPIYFKTLDT